MPLYRNDQNKSAIREWAPLLAQQHKAPYNLPMCCLSWSNTVFIVDCWPGVNVSLAGPERGCGLRCACLEACHIRHALTRGESGNDICIVSPELLLNR